MKLFLRTAMVTALSAAVLFADVTYQESVKLKSGSVLEVLQKMASNHNLPPTAANMMKHAVEDQNYDVYIRGNQMARIGAHSSSIYDLDAGTLTTINHDLQTFTVMTFDQVSQMMQQMQQRLGGGPSDLQFDVKVNKTGQTQQIDGETAQERVVILTAKQATEGTNTVVTTHSWLVPMNLLRKEAHNLQKRLGEKISTAMLSGVSPLLNFGSSGLSAAMAETSRFDDGYPALISASVTGSLGKSNPLAAIAAMSGASMSDPNEPLMVSETTFHHFVQGVADNSKFAIPAGYKEQKTPSLH